MTLEEMPELDVTGLWLVIGVSWGGEFRRLVRPEEYEEFLELVRPEIPEGTVVEFRMFLQSREAESIKEPKSDH